MRKYIVAGNWKMNTSVNEAKSLATSLRDTIMDKGVHVDIVVCPPYIHLSTVGAVVKEKNIHLGAQNCYVESNGAYTGEISATMLKDLGCKYVIIGHSERRQLFNEDHKLLQRKIEAALDAGLKPIYCLGETLEEREDGKHFQIIEKQLSEVLFSFGIADISEVAIAYEPIWAIGTGLAATAEQAQEIHAFIRSQITHQYDSSVGNALTILYGGSVKPGNAEQLFSKPDIDGGLIGGASLQAEDFLAIANAL